MKTLFPRMPDLIPAMVEQLGSRQIRRMCDIFLVFPAVVMMVVCGFYLALWRVDPFVRFAHMVWVLGFWMVGTLGMFSFIIPARLKLGFPILILIFSSIALFLAIDFTPLSSFTALFSNPPGLFVSSVIGFLNGLVSWLIVRHFRKEISER